MLTNLSKRAARHAGQAKDRARAREFKALIANQAVQCARFESNCHGRPGCERFTGYACRNSSRSGKTLFRASFTTSATVELASELNSYEMKSQITSATKEFTKQEQPQLSLLSGDVLYRFSNHRPLQPGRCIYQAHA